ncbi:MAG TPA: hypothetical protein VGD26_09460 [Chitinophagaceae bacterium]
MGQFEFSDDLHDLLEIVEKNEDDAEFRPIDKSYYLPELEEKVAHWMAITPDLPRNTIKHERIQIPVFESLEEKKAWVKEERRRCKYGHNGMCGTMYFFFNYCKMENLNHGKISPEYREADNQWFKYYETCKKSREWGVICVKRRRVGMSWKVAAMSVHDAIFFKNRHLGLNSKSDTDSQLLLLKIKFIFENLPEFFQIPTAQGYAKNRIVFGWYETNPQTKTKVAKGNQSDIWVVAPTDNAYEGRMLNMWICDEAGKIDNLRTMWTYTDDCLMQETRRVGMPIIFGTSGDVGKEGKDLKEMWKDSKIYRLKKYFFAGWNGLAVDEFGNDLKEECIRWIIYRRHELAQAGDESLLNVFIQKYPLCIDDAFNYTNAAGIGYREKIQTQLHSLRENPAEVRKGFFRRNANEQVEFVPTPHGKCLVYEHPIEHLKNAYVAGVDPTDHDDTFESASDLSMYIIKRAQGTEPPKVVFEYTDKPEKAEDYYDQAIMALTYYNQCRALIENNRYRMIAEMDKKGYKHLLAFTPTGITRMFGAVSRTAGIRMTPAVKEYLRQLLQEYVNYHCGWIPSVELLEEFMIFGAKNTDKAMAFGIALIYLKDDKRLVMDDKKDDRLPQFGYKKVNGKVMRYEKFLPEPKIPDSA